MLSDQKSSHKTLYEQDFYRWTQTTAHLLQQHRYAEIDWKNLLEEIESMGRSERKELKSRLIVLIEHLLKLMYWEAEKPSNSRGWRNTVIEQRRQLELLLEESPSLRSVLLESFLDCYTKSREDTLRKYQLPPDLLPNHPPFTIETVLNSDYFPE
jgi:hypothetical protein